LLGDIPLMCQGVAMMLFQKLQSNLWFALGLVHFRLEFLLNRDNVTSTCFAMIVCHISGLLFHFPAALPFLLPNLCSTLFLFASVRLRVLLDVPQSLTGTHVGEEQH